MANDSRYSGNEGIEMNFIVDIEKLNTLKNELNTASYKIEEEVEEIYNLIYSLGGEGENSADAPWQGDSYEAFKAKCDESKPALESLSLVIRAYSKMIEDQVFVQANDLVANVNSNLSLGE